MAASRENGLKEHTGLPMANTATSARGDFGDSSLQGENRDTRDFYSVYLRNDWCF